MTLFIQRSQHLTDLSSPHEKRQGWNLENYKALIVLMWPVRDIFNQPDAMSQNFMVRSADPDAKKVLHGDTLKHLTHPWWPTMTLQSLKGGCHVGLISLRKEEERRLPNRVDSARFISSLLLTTNDLSTGKSDTESPIFDSYFQNVLIFPFFSPSSLIYQIILVTVFSSSFWSCFWSCTCNGLILERNGLYSPSNFILIILAMKSSSSCWGWNSD